MLSASVSGFRGGNASVFVDIVAHVVFDCSSISDAPETVFYMGDPFDTSVCGGCTNVVYDISDIGIEHVENGEGYFIIVDDGFCTYM